MRKLIVITCFCLSAPAMADGIDWNSLGMLPVQPVMPVQQVQPIGGLPPQCYGLKPWNSDPSCLVVCVNGAWQTVCSQ